MLCEVYLFSAGCMTVLSHVDPKIGTGIVSI